MRNRARWSIKSEDQHIDEVQPEQHYTYEAAGKLMMLKPDTIRKKVAQGLIRVQRYGKKTVRIPESEIIRIQRDGW